MKSEQPALAVQGLTKRFDRLAVDALDLTIRGGEFYALVGPNGAGKTTTLRMVAGLLRPDAGSVAIFGVDALQEFLELDGAVPGMQGSDHLTGVDIQSGVQTRGPCPLVVMGGAGRGPGIIGKIGAVRSSA